MKQTAEALLASLRSGDLEGAGHAANRLREMMSLPASESEMRATAALIWESRTVAAAYRAQAAEALRALARDQHYSPSGNSNPPGFQLLA